MFSLERYNKFKCENAPGKGFFHIRIIEGENAPREHDVPVFNFGPEQKADYFAELVTTTTPIVAMRDGPKGICTFAINPKLIQVNRVDKNILRRSPVLDSPDAVYWKKVDQTAQIAENRYVVADLESRGNDAPEIKGDFKGEFIEIVGRTIADEPFKAWVYYKPSQG